MSAGISCFSFASCCSISRQRISFPSVDNCARECVVSDCDFVSIRSDMSCAGVSRWLIFELSLFSSSTPYTLVEGSSMFIVAEPVCSMLGFWTSIAADDLSGDGDIRGRIESVVDNVQSWSEGKTFRSEDLESGVRRETSGWLRAAFDGVC